MHLTQALILEALEFEDRVTKFEFRGTVNLHLHGTVYVYKTVHVHCNFSLIPTNIILFKGS